MLKKLFMRFALLACCLSVVSVWGKSFSIDLRTPTAKTAKQIRAKSNVIALPQGADGTLRKVNLAARAADVGVVAVGDELTFTLFDDVAITLTLKKQMPSPLGGDVFLAEASGYDGVKNAVVLRTADGLTIDVQDYRNRKVYKVISTATGVMVQEMEAKGGKCGCDALEPPNQGGRASAKPSKAKNVVAAKNVESDETCVDILVAYDKNAATWANANGGGVTNFAQMAVQRMNTVLVNNGLDGAFRFRLVGIAQVSTSSADLDSALDAATKGSGDWAPIKAKRDDVGADIVTVLIDTGTAYGTTGLGWSLRTTDFESFAESAYHVCAIRSVAQSHTMTHEVGHNMGCGHSDEMADRSNCGPQLYNYSAGCYITEWFPVEEGSEWSREKKLHTIMAYDDNGYGDIYEEIPYFSSAEKQYTCNGKSVVVGDETHDNTRTLENTYAAVAKWRAQKTPMTYEIRFEPASGTTFEDSVKVTLASTRADAEIRYTLDGSEPTADSVLYSGTITLTDSTTIRAVAVVDGVCGFPYEAAYTKSTLASAIGGDGLTWTFSDDLAWSVYDLPYPESYDLPDYPSPDGLGIRAVRHGPDDAKTAWLETEITGPCDISFFDLFAGAESMSIYLDGDEIPGTGRVSLSYGKCHWGEPTVVNVPAGNHTVKIVITIDADGWWDYTSDGEQYVILDGFMVHRVSAPVLSPATSDNKDYATTFQKEQRVSISSPSDMALIYYTLDGSDPGGESGILYDGPLFINKTTTVKAVAMEPGQDTPSVIATGLYIEKTPLPPPKPGEWTGDAESAFDAAEKDGKMVAVLCMNYAGCMWSQALEPVLRDASFLSWAKANGVYLVNTDDGWLDGDAASSDYFWDLYNDSPLSAELDGYVYYPTFCFASPSDRNVCLGAMLARNDGEHTANGIAYEDTPESLIACFASMLGKMPLGAPVATVTEDQVTLVNTNGTGTLYYTLDGSAPTRERGMIYGGAVTVPVGATLQAVVWPNDVDDVSGITFTYENEDFGMKMGIPGMIWQNDDQHPWKTDGTGRVSIDGTNVSKLVVRVSSPGVISFQMGYHYGGDIELSVNGTEIGCCDAWSRVSQEIENPDGGEITWTFKPSAWCDAPEAWLNELKWSPLPDSPIVRAEGGSVNYGTLIRWDDVYGAIKYLVYRATVNDTSAAVKVAETTQCRFWDSDSKDGSKYWYWVKTVNDYGESNFSMGILAGVRSISVSFDANGGSGIMATQMFVGDVAQALAKNTFTREGYVFLGWTTSAGGEVVYMDGQDLAVVSDMTLYAVWEMANLAAFTIEDGVLTDVKLNGATVIAIPDGVSAIADNVFAQLRGLKGVTIPDGVTSIGSSAFWCAGLMNVTIPDSVTSIGSCAFSWCESLGSATIGNGVTSIGYCMFENCSKLVNVTLPETLRSIESGAFYRCTSLRNIKIPAGMAYIDDTAFSGCINLTVHAPSTLRDTFSVPATCTIEYYDVPEYTVTLDANGGTVSGQPSISVQVETGKYTNQAAANRTVARAGYTLLGWYDAKSGGNMVFDARGYAVNGKYWNGAYSPGVSSATWKGAGNVTAYARWVESSTHRVVTFDANGGAISNATTYAVVEQGKYTSQAGASVMDAARAGYTLVGWYDTNASSGGNMVFDARGYAVNGKYWNGAYSPGVSSATWKGAGNLTAYARWVASPPYRVVTFDANGGAISNASYNCVVVEQGKYTMQAGASGTKVARAGYTLVGWYDAKTGGNMVFNAQGYAVNGTYWNGTYSPKVSSAAWKYDGSVTAYAQWAQNRSTVTLDANGGTVSGQSSVSVQVEYGKYTNQAAGNRTVARTGYTLVGWYDAKSGGSMVFDARGYAVNGKYWNGAYSPSVSSATWKGYGNLTAYARWVESSTHMVVTFDANGGAISNATTCAVVEQGKYTSQAGASVLNATRTGYTLRGWYDAKSGGNMVFDARGFAVNGKYWNGAYSPSASSATWKGAGNVTAYAQWVATPPYRIVTFDANGGIIGNASCNCVVEQGKYTSQAGASVLNATRSGYTLLGWYDAKSGGDMVFDAQGYAVNGTYWNGSYVPSKTSATWNGTVSVTAYARWAQNKSTVTLDANGGTVSGSATVSFQVEYGKYTSQAGANRTVSRSGYTLRGWYDAKSGGNMVFDARGYAVNGKYWNGAYSPSVSSATWKGTGNVTVYAQWVATPPYRVVTFDANGGVLGNATCNCVVEQGKYTSQAGASAMNATRTGYTLVGWYDAKTGGNMVFNAQGYAVNGTYWNGSYVPSKSSATWKYAGSVTAYARWVPIASNIRMAAPSGNMDGDFGAGDMVEAGAPLFFQGEYEGVFADDDGRFMLTLDEGLETAYFVTWTDDGGVACECEAAVAGDVLILTTETGAVYHLVWDEDGLVATRIE